jgi:prephenate dehydrogenase
VVDQLAIIGCGLMGGSFALALRAAGLVRRVVGHSRSPASALRAQQLGVVDTVTPTAAAAAEGSDLVLLSVPVASTEATLRSLRDALGPAALCMDVGSTKADVAAAAVAALGPRLSRFVPAHPIAGKERAGIEHADAALYRGCRVVLTPGEATDPACTARASALWTALGARVQVMSAQAHDDALAAVSHLPHLLAFAYFQAVAGQPEGERYLALAGPGFRDFTRIAAGDPALWRDVFVANRPQVLRHGAAFRAELQRFEAALEAGDAAAIEALIAGPSAGRGAWKPVSETADPPAAGELGSPPGGTAPPQP